MNHLVIFVIIGAFVGWLASIVMQPQKSSSTVITVMLGAVGALLSGWLLAPLFGAGGISQEEMSLVDIIFSVVGAILFMSVAHLVRRGQVRW